MSIRTRPLANGGEAFQARYRDRFGKQKSKNFTTRGEAMTFLKEVSDRRYGNGTVDGGSSQRCGAWIDEWGKARGARKGWAQTTRASYKHLIESAIRPYLGTRRLRDLRPGVLLEWQGALLLDGRAATTANNALSLLSTCLDEALIREKIDVNPCLPIERLSHASPQVLVPTPFEIELVIAHLPSVRDQKRAEASFGLGLRPEEASALRRCDLGGGVARIWRAWSSASELRGPKNGAFWPIEIMPHVVADLEALLDMDSDSDTLLFPNRYGGHYNVSNWTSRVWMPAVRASGVGRRIIPYDLRHAYASLLIHEGHPISRVQTLTRHQDQSTLLKTYSHSYSGRLPAGITFEDAVGDARERVRRQLRGKELPIQARRDPGGRKRHWSDEQLLRGYLTASRALGTRRLSRREYEDYRADHDCSLASEGALSGRFGTWAEARTRALALDARTP